MFCFCVACYGEASKCTENHTRGAFPSPIPIFHLGEGISEYQELFITGIDPPVNRILLHHPIPFANAICEERKGVSR